MEALEISALRSIGISDPYGYREGRKTQKWLTTVATPARKSRTVAKADDYGGDCEPCFSVTRADIPFARKWKTPSTNMKRKSTGLLPAMGICRLLSARCSKIPFLFANNTVAKFHVPRSGKAPCWGREGAYRVI